MCNADAHYTHQYHSIPPSVFVLVLGFQTEKSCTNALALKKTCSHAKISATVIELLFVKKKQKKKMKNL